MKIPEYPFNPELLVGHKVEWRQPGVARGWIYRIVKVNKETGSMDIYSLCSNEMFANFEILEYLEIMEEN